MALRERLAARFPLVAAHRGASRFAPENTMAAFRRARELGASAIELDVQITADREVVVLHDTTLERTTNGSGRVEDQSWAGLARLDAGRWFGDAFAGEAIPLLEEVLAWAKGSVFVNIELKPPRRDDGILERRVVDLVRSYGMEDEALAMSFDHVAIERVKRAAPEVIGLVICGARLAREIPYLQAIGADGSNHSLAWWTPSVCGAFRDAGLIAHASYLNAPDQWRTAHGAGLDMVDSDEPAVYGGEGL